MESPPEEDISQSPGRSRAIDALVRWRWALPWVTAVAAFGAIVAAWLTGGQTRDLDPCAGAFDNVWGGSSFVLIWVSVGLSALLTVAALVTRKFSEARSGLIRTSLMFLCLFALWVVFVIGGYGWHCPEPLGQW